MAVVPSDWQPRNNPNHYLKKKPVVLYYVTLKREMIPGDGSINEVSFT